MAKIEKADAAERLIVAAIEMVERNAEPLAAHLVATSALNVLRDLLKQADQEYVSELTKKGMFALAEAQAKGVPFKMELPSNVTAQIDELAAKITSGVVSGPDDLKVVHEKPWELLKYVLNPSNFLKHAERDPLATLEEADFDPDGAIAHALSAYSILRPGHPLPDTIKPYLEKHDLV